MNSFFLPHIQSLKPYSSAREESSVSSGTAAGKLTLLDANENSLGSASDLRLGTSTLELNRYPDPLQVELKKVIGDLYGIESEQLFLGNGSDEAIDLLIRGTCAPGKDKILISSPTYGIYKVLADLSGVPVVDVPLRADYSLDVPAIRSAEAKLVFICSPNNPTGNEFSREDIRSILSDQSKLVILDEAYADFAGGEDSLPLLQEFKNLVILRTFSKSWGMAGLRLGACLARPEIIKTLNSIKLPYNISAPNQALALQAIDGNRAFQSETIKVVSSEREKLVEEWSRLDGISEILPSVTNFLLVRFADQIRASEVYTKLIELGFVVRDRSNLPLCENCLRISIGTPEENARLTEALETKALEAFSI